MSSLNIKDVIIHHISDIHIGPIHFSIGKKSPFDKIAEIDNVKPLFGQNADRYLDHIESLPLESRPDFILVTGDLTSYAAENEMHAAKDWLIKISKLIRRKTVYRDEDDPCIFVIPGNHDVNWEEEKYDDKIKRFNGLFESLLSEKILGAVSPSDNKPFHFCKKSNILFYLFNSTKLGGTDRQDILSIYKDLSSLGTELSSSKGDEDLSTLLVNLNDLIKQDPGYIPVEDLKKMEKDVAEFKGAMYRIALMHHNPVSVPSDELETFDTIINSGLVKQYLIKAEFDMVAYGHRHMAHGSNERYLSSKDRQGIYFIGAPSLGCPEHSPFLEIKLSDIYSIHKEELPSVLLTVRELSHNQAGLEYRYTSGVVAQEPVDKPMHFLLNSIHQCLGRVERKLNKTEQEQIFSFIKTLTNEQDKIQGWNSKNTWTDIFYDYLGSYNVIYATDIDDRHTISSPKYQTYLLDQFSERIKNIKPNRGRKKELLFSPIIYGAIKRTGWMLVTSEWENYNLTSSINKKQLQIVRVLIKEKYDEIDRDRLYKLDYDHRTHAIPLFVIEKRFLDNVDLRDFTLGIDSDDIISRCYSYKEDNGEVSEDRSEEAEKLRDDFEKLLENIHLRTIPDYVSRSMLLDPYRMESFSKNYDNTRKASTSVINFITQEISSSKKVVIDIGCGTGNYTIPFLKMGFEQIYGVDTCKYMLQVAKNKTNESNVRWIKGDGREIDLDLKCDLIISICSLHYIKGHEQQKLLFSNMFNLLEEGGKMIFESEFIETLDSFWLFNYFPSLSTIYKESCYDIEFYKSILTTIGFKKVSFKGINDKSAEDAMFRVGQNKPEIYLENNILKNLPVFQRHIPKETLNKGVRKLKKDIKSNRIAEVIDEYRENFENKLFNIKDNIFFIVAEK